MPLMSRRALARLGIRQCYGVRVKQLGDIFKLGTVLCKSSGNSNR